jgi:hypothetical protein
MNFSTPTEADAPPERHHEGDRSRYMREIEVAPVAGYALAEPGATLMIIALCEKCLGTIEDDWTTGAEKIAEWQNRAQTTWR